jgi:phospholipid transport system substrate-binding protein
MRNALRHRSWAARLANTPGLLAIGAVLLSLIAISAKADSANAEDRAVAFMRQAANALIQAQRANTPEAFQTVIQRYGHVPAIGLFALGNYRDGLPANQRPSYYRGLARFVGRYAATESPKYPVLRVTFASAAVRDGRNIFVDSQVHLQDGTYYNVRWLLAQNRNTFKVRDAQVLGFWVSPFLQTLFEDYIRKHGGRVDALVIALNQ